MYALNEGQACGNSEICGGVKGFEWVGRPCFAQRECPQECLLLPYSSLNGAARDFWSRHMPPNSSGCLVARPICLFIKRLCRCSSRDIYRVCLFLTSCHSWYRLCPRAFLTASQGESVQGFRGEAEGGLSLIHISEPTRPY